MDKPHSSRNGEGKTPGIPSEAAWRKAETCPHCGIKVLRTRMLRHLRRAHPEVLLTEQRARPALVRCKTCGVLVREDRIGRHDRKAHANLPASGTSTPAQPKKKRFRPHVQQRSAVINEDNQSSAVGPVESCDLCRTRVVFKQIKGKGRKAYDVDPNGRILWAHACDGAPRSESVYAINGGAIDSNRRRH